MKLKIGKEPYFFASLLAINVAFIWLFPVFLTQDGPSHLYNSKIFLSLILNPEGYLASLHDFNSSVLPNYFSTVVEAFLLLVFPPIIVEKVFISLLIIAFPLSMRFMLKHINPMAIYLSVFAFVMVISHYLFLGFFNYLWGLVFIQLFIGLSLSIKDSINWKNVFLLALLLVLIYYSQPISLPIAFILIGLKFVIYFLKKQYLDMLKLVLLSMPVLILDFYYSILRSLMHEELISIFSNNINLFQIRHLVIWDSLISFPSFEKYLLILITVAFFFQLITIIPKSFKVDFTANKTLLVALLVFSLLAYFIINDELGSVSYINVRFRIIIYILSIGTIASLQLKENKVVKLLTIVIVSAATIGILAARYPYLQKINYEANNFIKFQESVPDNITYIPVIYSPNGELGKDTLSPIISIFRHLGSYSGCLQDRISLSNYEASSYLFPVLWDDKKRDLYFGSNNQINLEASPPQIDLELYHDSLKNADWIVTWGDATRFEADSVYLNFEKQLIQHYQLQKKSTTEYSKLFRLQ